MKSGKQSKHQIIPRNELIVMIFLVLINTGFFIFLIGVAISIVNILWITFIIISFVIQQLIYLGLLTIIANMDKRVAKEVTHGKKRKN
jgi:hypothetical protein